MEKGKAIQGLSRRKGFVDVTSDPQKSFKNRDSRLFLLLSLHSPLFFLSRYWLRCCCFCLLWNFEKFRPLKWGRDFLRVVWSFSVSSGFSTRAWVVPKSRQMRLHPMLGHRQMMGLSLILSRPRHRGVQISLTQNVLQQAWRPRASVPWPWSTGYFRGERPSHSRMPSSLAIRIWLHTFCM